MATELWIANASPLILLGKAGLLELLLRLAEVVLIPEAVWDEIARGPGGEQLVRILRRQERFRVLPNEPIPATLMAWDLGVGESQVIAAGAAEVPPGQMERRVASIVRNSRNP